MRAGSCRLDGDDSDPTAGFTDERALMRFRLLPTDEGFFDLFSDAARNVADCARLLAKLFDDPANPSVVDEVVDCERRGDAITERLLRRLDTSFVTPFDREDIHALAEKFDDVVDDMKTVAERVRALSVTSTVPWLHRQAELLVELGAEGVGLVEKLEAMKGLNGHLEAIDRLESEGDTIYNEALAHLDVLRWKDLVEAMEAAINRMEDVGDIVESIMHKHA
jgi:uncharacterized protein Yka (UPF0111/DUF47 family)